MKATFLPLFLVFFIGLYVYVFLVIEDHLEYDCLEEVRLTRAEIPIKCNILTSQSDEKMCQHLWQQSDQFLNATSVSTRINNCPNYFSLVSTTAYLPVMRNETYLAFSVVAHNQIGLLESLLATIFRQHNSYCIFVDTKSTIEFKTQARALIDCYKFHFPKTEIFLASKTHPVFWSDFSLLEADLGCMAELLKRDKKWRYFINQAASVMPQMDIRVASSLINKIGKDSIFSTQFPERLKERISFRYERPKTIGHNVENEKNSYIYDAVPSVTNIPKEPPPYGLVIYKGYREVILRRSSARLFLETDLSQSLLNWCKDVIFPEEVFFATLARVDFEKYLSTNQTEQTHVKRPHTYPICPRKTLWNYSTKTCYGQRKRWMCNLGLRDLVLAFKEPCLFVNKFDITVDPRPVMCLRDFFTPSKPL